MIIIYTYNNTIYSSCVLFRNDENCSAVIINCEEMGVAHFLMCHKLGHMVTCTFHRYSKRLVKVYSF